MWMGAYAKFTYGKMRLSYVLIQVVANDVPRKKVGEMKKSHLGRAFGVLVCTFALSMGLVACSGETESAGVDSFDTADVSGGVAATVNGVEIGENAVTAYIENFRMNNSLTEDADWAQWLVDYDYTVDSLRGEIVDYFVSQELVRQAAAENGITVDEEAIDQQVESMKSNYASEEEWNAALAAVGIGDETQYRSMLELYTLEADLEDTVAEDGEVSEDDLLMYAQMYASAYDGAKRSSHILFSADDEATAQEVLDKINSGELDFAAAAEQYSTDTGSAVNGGDVGWDKMTQFVTEYQTALDGLSKDEVSGLVTSEYGIHIIKCTDEFIAPEEVTSVDQVPAEWMDGIRAQLAESAKSMAYQEWMQNYHDSADIVVSDMPEGLPYVVDLSGYTPSEGSYAASMAAMSVETAPEGAVETEAAPEGAEQAEETTEEGVEEVEPLAEDGEAPEGAGEAS